jgi:hypothetical protein
MADAAAAASTAGGEAAAAATTTTEPPSAAPASSSGSVPAQAAAAPAAAPSGLPRPSTGVVLFAGSAAHSMTGRKDPPAAWDGVPETNLYSFHVFAALKDAKVGGSAGDGVGG